jgi:KAP family P-loop domain
VEQPIEMKDADQLVTWLEGKPREWGVTLAIRAALRVLPLTHQILQSSASPELQKRLMLTAYRAAFVGWAGRLHHFDDPSSPTYAALRAASASAYAAADADAYAAGSIAYADAAAAAARTAAYAAAAGSAASADAAAAAASAASAASIVAAASAAALWESITADASWLLNDSSSSSDELVTQPLWLNEVRDDPKYNVNLPPWARTPFDTFDQSAWVQQGLWGVWTEWYRGVLAHKQASIARSRFGEKADVAIALKDDSFWSRDPDVVTAEIAEIAGYRPRRIRDPSNKDGSSAAPEKVEDPPAPATDQQQAPAGPPDAEKPDVNIGFQSDTPDLSVDYLDRARLAFVLAGRLNRVWDEMNPAPDGRRRARWLKWFHPAAPVRSNDPLGAGFVVHLDAPWGGGKTTFSDYLVRILNPYREAGPLPDWLNDLPLKDAAYWPEGFRRPWHIVKFNAWRHQHVTPPWWVFAEAIRKECSSAMLREVNQQAGVLPPPPAFVSRSWFGRVHDRLWVFLQEYVWRLVTLDLAVKAVSTFAVAGVLVGLLYAGLLVFGDKGMKLADDSVLARWASIASMIAVGVPTLWAVAATLMTSLLPGTPEAAKNYSLGAGDPLDRFRRHFAKTILRFRRPVVVVVDDLDRCEPGYIVELIRGMQTILVSPRVVFLLLGDRDWIEQAFSEMHKAMKGVYVGPEHEFGGRFVEKAIQFSFVLPEVPEEKRTTFVRRLLQLRDRPAKPDDGDVQRSATAAAEAEQLAARTEAVLKTADYGQREAAAADLRSEITRGPALPEQQQLLEEFDVKLSLRAAADTSAERATSHMIEALAPKLPANPRQIKRIINAISLMQEAARLEGLAQPGSPEWQVLARWVVIMTEWPKTFYTLSRYPTLADRVLAPAPKEGDEPEPSANGGKPSDPVGELSATAAKYVELIKANPEVMALLTFSDDAKGWPKRDIGTKEVDWLRKLMPPASGRFLTADEGEKAQK